MDDLFHNQNPMIGANLKTIRQRRKISQSKLAELSGLTPETISRIENGSDCTSHTIGRLCHGLGCTADELIQGTMEVPRDKQVEILIGDIETLPTDKKNQVLDTVKALVAYWKYR